MFFIKQENYPDTINEELDTINQNSSQNASEATKSRRKRKESQREEVQRNEQLAPSQSNRNVPAAMRSSFVFGVSVVKCIWVVFKIFYIRC